MIDDLQRAMDLLRRPGRHMIQTNRMRVSHHYIVPDGGSISTEVAEKIKAHPQVKGDADSLWPGMSQVWRMR